MIKERKIGPALKIRAKDKGITQQALADACGVSRVAIHRFFKGATELKATDFLAVLKKLDVKLDPNVIAIYTHKPIITPHIRTI